MRDLESEKRMDEVAIMMLWWWLEMEDDGPEILVRIM